MCAVRWIEHTLLCPSPVGKGAAVSVAFVRPSVAYIANNSRTERPSVSVPKFGMKVPHL